MRANKGSKRNKDPSDGMAQRWQEDAGPRIKPVSGTVRPKSGVSGQEPWSICSKRSHHKVAVSRLSEPEQFSNSLGKSGDLNLLGKSGDSNLLGKSGDLLS